MVSSELLDEDRRYEYLTSFLVKYSEGLLRVLKRGFDAVRVGVPTDQRTVGDPEAVVDGLVKMTEKVVVHSVVSVPLCDRFVNWDGYTTYTSLITHHVTVMKA